MSSEDVLEDIHYFEHKIVNELMHAHITEYGKALRAIILFGRTKTPGPPFNIELLEVIDDWPELSHFQTNPSATLPMRGSLYLHFVSSREFEHFAFQHTQDPSSLQDLMTQVMEGYRVIYQVPAGYAREILTKVHDSQQSYPASVYLADPFKPPLLNKG